ERSGFLDRLGLDGSPFGLCTLHRPSNVDVPEVLEGLLETLAEIAVDMPVLLPLHPRTRLRIEQFGLGARIAAVRRPTGRRPPRGVLGLEPLSYLEMLKALRAAQFVHTDSRGA